MYVQLAAVLSFFPLPVLYIKISRESCCNDIDDIIKAFKGGPILITLLFVDKKSRTLASLYSADKKWEKSKIHDCVSEKKKTKGAAVKPNLSKRPDLEIIK